jgi:hypothetical protein
MGKRAVGPRLQLERAPHRSDGRNKAAPLACRLLLAVVALAACAVLSSLLIDWLR